MLGRTIARHRASLGPGSGAQCRYNTPKPATISGIVTDQYGDPLSRAEIVVQPGNYSALIDDGGKFRIQVPVGEYNVVFRRVGYGPEDFRWRARAGEGTVLSIRLNPLPQARDTVVIRDSHNRVAEAREEFDRRQRWTSASNYTVGRDVFARLGKSRSTRRYTARRRSRCSDFQPEAMDPFLSTRPTPGTS